MQHYHCSFPFWYILCFPPVHLVAVVNVWSLEACINVFTELVSFPVLVKCIKNTPGYFAERLYKAMKVRHLVLMEPIACMCWVVICANQLFRGLGPKTGPWFGSWSPVLRLTCWIFDRSMWGTTANRCTQTSLWVFSQITEWKKWKKDDRSKRFWVFFYRETPQETTRSSCWSCVEAVIERVALHFRILFR